MAMNCPVVVIGGTNIDIIASTNETVRMHDSNPGLITRAYGGVGRNVVENLARLDVPVFFITAVGHDEVGETIVGTLESLGAEVVGPSVTRTSSYVAIHDHLGDMKLAVNDMQAMAMLTVEVLRAHEAKIRQAPVVVMDANVSAEVIQYVTRLTPRTIVDAVSTAKVTRLAAALADMDTLKLNNHEASALVGHSVKDVDDALRAATTLKAQGLKHVYLTMGQAGVVVADAQRARHHPAPSVPHGKANGAGDAFTAGIAYGRYREIDELPVAFELARLTLQVDGAVHPDLKHEFGFWMGKQTKN